jgi:drug/metabolite transporter (DMT)-like permease
VADTRSAWWTALAAILAVALWSSTFAIYKIAFRRFDPLAFTGVRYLLLVPLAGGFLWATRARRRSTGPDLRRAALAGVFGYFMLELTFVLGLDRTSAIASAILVATHPIWGVGFAAAADRRRPAAREIAGLAVGIAGIVVFFGGPEALSEFKIGDLLSLGTAIAFGAYGAMTDRLSDRMPAGELMATSLLSGGVLLLLVSMPAVVSQDWSVVLPVDWLILLYTAVGPILAGFALWNFALRRRGIGRTAPFGYLEPLFATALAVAVLGESFSMIQVVGGALVLAGVVLAAGLRAEPATPPAL